MSPGGQPLTVAIAGAPVSSLFLRVVRLHRLVATAMLEQEGLSPPQELILLYVGEHGGIDVPQRNVVRYIGRDRSTVASSCQALERRGAIERRADDHDLRQQLVSLTALGHALVPRIRQTWASLETTTLHGLSARDQLTFAKFLSIIEGTLSGALEDPA